MREFDDEETKQETNEFIQTEADLPPEFCHYHDEGCELAESCLSCPLPQCIFDQPRGKQRWLKERRDKEIVRMFKGGDWGMKELASLFGLSQRTVQRALKARNSRQVTTGKESNAQ
jgi:hypothetical protein